MREAVEDFLRTLGTFLPKLVAFLLILIIGYFVAKLLEKLINKLLEKVGFDRAVERGGLKKVLQGSQLDPSDILARIVFYAVMLFVLSTAFGVFGDNPVSDYLAAIIGYLPKIFVAILILVIAAALAAGAKLLIQNALGGLSYGRTLGTAASVFILALGVIAALDQLQIAQNVVNAVLIAGLAMVVGIAVVAVGGGGIVPMRRRWENALGRVEDEAPNVRREMQESKSAKDALREEAAKYQQGSDPAAQPGQYQPSRAGGPTGNPAYPAQGEISMYGAPGGGPINPAYGAQGGQPATQAYGAQGEQARYGAQGEQARYGAQGEQPTYGAPGRGDQPGYADPSGQPAPQSYGSQPEASTYDSPSDQSTYAAPGDQPPAHDSAWHQLSPDSPDDTSPYGSSPEDDRRGSQHVGEMSNQPPSDTQSYEEHPEPSRAQTMEQPDPTRARTNEQPRLDDQRQQATQQPPPPPPYGTQPPPRSE